MLAANPFQARLIWVLTRAFLIVFCSLVNAASISASEVNTRIPILKNIGIIPTTVEDPQGQDPKVADILTFITDEFPKIVENSSKFRIVNSEVVKELWSTSTGRKNLLDEYELHAFLNLSIALISDTIQLTVRLLDPSLKNLLQEQNRFSRNELMSSSSTKIYDSVESLLFSLLNRLPADANVTSIQGAFVTISAGSEQGLMVGDNLEIERVRIKSLHPATGTWLDFSASKLGTASIVDVKPQNSVARLIHLSRDNAIEVGDSIKISNINSRKKFARLTEESRFKDRRDADSLIVPPVYLNSLTDNTDKNIDPRSDFESKISANNQLPHQPKTAHLIKEQDATDLSQAINPEESGISGQKPPPEEAPENKSSVDFLALLDRMKSPNNKWIDDIQLYFGPRWWSVKGPANSSGKFPLWLVNSVGLDVTRTIIYKIKIGFGGTGYFGQTSKGNYAGYEGYARLYWEDEFNLNSRLLSWWRFGGNGSLNGMSVSRERYGGGDWLRGGMFFAAGGQLDISTSSPLPTSYDWFAETALMPLNIGRFGYSGKQYLIESAFGTRFSIGAYERQGNGALKWGGGLDVNDDRLTLKNGRRPHLTDYNIKVLAKYQF